MEQTAPEQRARWLWIIAAIVFTSACALVFVSREPSYRGKSLSEWLAQLDASTNANRRMEATAAIREIGAAALPRLVDELRCHDSGLVVRLRSLVQRQKLVRWQFTTAMKRRVRAHAAFHELYEIGTPVAPQLASALSDTDADVRVRAGKSF